MRRAARNSARLALRLGGALSVVGGMVALRAGGADLGDLARGAMHQARVFRDGGEPMPRWLSDLADGAEVCELRARVDELERGERMLVREVAQAVMALRDIAGSGGIADCFVTGQELRGKARRALESLS